MINLYIISNLIDEMLLFLCKTGIYLQVDCMGRLTLQFQISPCWRNCEFICFTWSNESWDQKMKTIFYILLFFHTCTYMLRNLTQYMSQDILKRGSYLVYRDLSNNSL